MKKTYRSLVKIRGIEFLWITEEWLWSSNKRKLEFIMKWKGKRIKAFLSLPTKWYLGSIED